MASAAEKAQAPLRAVAVATFFPAFALCVAHGVKSSRPVPAVGLVPLAFSSGLSTFQLVRLRQASTRNKNKNKRTQSVVRRPSQPQDNDAAESQPLAPQEQQQQQQGEEDGYAGDENDDVLTEPRHPILTFFADVVLAAALMVVLVFTWIQTGGSAELAMLAAYATIPLLVNFFIHLSLAVREFSRGLAIPALMQYLAWQVVPGSCPDCGRHLRPDTTPAMPWFAAATSTTSHPSSNSPSAPASPADFFRSFKMPPSMKKPWRNTTSGSGSGGRAAFLPPWFSGSQQQQQRYTDLDEDAHHHNGAADHGDGGVVEEAAVAAAAPYRDEPEAAGQPSTTLTSDVLEEPEEVEVVGKKKKKRSQGSVDQGSSRVWSDS
ncbi:uncharacterized protein PG986_002898 [Apiospora aurea]|uniref:Uncharacterized protein n=1 Tax=Apiospora aurea TaxID=335848 RepID=A0ABR1QQ45_9PEZI